MSLKNIISFGNYTPPAPAKIKTNSPDLVKDYTMANGDISRYLIRPNLIQITADFAFTKNQLDEFHENVRTSSELEVTYDGNNYYMFVTAYSETPKNVRISGNYEVSITLKECRRNGI